MVGPPEWGFAMAWFGRQPPVLSSYTDALGGVKEFFPVQLPSNRLRWITAMGVAVSRTSEAADVSRRFV
jgi:hypothetical protein